jgi:hypothetical protein
MQSGYLTSTPPQCSRSSLERVVSSVRELMLEVGHTFLECVSEILNIPIDSGLGEGLKLNTKAEAKLAFLSRFSVGNITPSLS